MNNLIVMKFGAAAIGDAARLRDLARVVRDARDGDYAVVVVCTALSGITDALIEAARAAAEHRMGPAEFARRELWGRHRALAEKLINDEWEREELFREWADLLKSFDRITRSVETLGELSPRGIDAVAALGERFMARLVAVVLRRSGIASRMFDGADLIVTDTHYGNARPLVEETFTRIKTALALLVQTRIVPVVTGYVGATRQGAVTTLGRGGGDYSAALLGAALDADEVCLWTDVDGILTADPKLVPSAQTLSEISYAEAAKIAALGAEVLHPHTLAPMADRGIPLHIRNLNRPDRAGTRVVTQAPPTSYGARTIISAIGLSLISITAAGAGQDWGPTLTRMAETSVDILSFTQSVSEHNLTLAVRAADAQFAKEYLLAVLQNEAANSAEVSVVARVGLVALICSPGSMALMPQVLLTLGRAGAQVLSLVRGAGHISLLLPEEQIAAVVQALHDDLLITSR
jgi:aspartate kinase